ncbi:ComF family protein [Staphylococcus equorum]|uniref:ComF family protein n=1 Tax=Staphylococcus equorum TaxID=246432 RepID=UPI0039819466
MSRCIQCHHTFSEAFNAFTFYKKASKLCESCLEQWDDINIKPLNRCVRCLKKLDENEKNCLDCLFLATKYNLMNQLYCQYQYKGMLKTLIHQYKFKKDVAICEILATQLQFPKISYDYIVPIPSPLVRDKERTFNPVLAVLDEMGVNYEPLLYTRVRPKQSLLGKQLRAQSKNPFEIVKNIDLENKNILLVDDIYTTGLTVHNAAELLFVRKIRKFDVFTFAR